MGHIELILKIQYFCEKLTLFKKSKIASFRDRHFGPSLNLPYCTSDNRRAGCEHSRHGSFRRPGARPYSIFFVGVGLGRKPYLETGVTVYNRTEKLQNDHLAAGHFFWIFRFFS